MIAEGGESGGHVGDLTTMALLPQVCDANAAAGNRRRRYCRRTAAWRQLLCWVRLAYSWEPVFWWRRNAAFIQSYKDKILKANDIATIATGKAAGPSGALPENPLLPCLFPQGGRMAAVSDEELEALGVGALRLAAVEGDEQRGCFLAGQVAALVKERAACR